MIDIRNNSAITDNVYNRNDIIIHDSPSKHMMENLNLIEEVYVTSGTKQMDPPPVTSVQMKAFYPQVQFGKDTTRLPVLDSDSGHESGATSPCDNPPEVASPPPSPPTPQISDRNLQYEKNLRKLVINKDENDHNKASFHAVNNNNRISSVAVAKVSETHDFHHRLHVVDGSRDSTHYVVVAIDFGTTYSGYAFSFTNDPENIHMMKKWEGKARL